MIALLVTIYSIWLVLSLAMYVFARMVFKKYQSMPRPHNPHEHAGIMRRDFGNWKQTEILKGCFIRFPLHFLALFVYIVVLAALANLSKYLKFPTPSMIEAYRRIFGRKVFRTMFNLR